MPIDDDARKSPFVISNLIANKNYIEMVVGRWRKGKWLVRGKRRKAGELVGRSFEAGERWILARN
jgi:hypothetical protein